MRVVIASFTGQYRFLSNFYPCEIRSDQIYPSVEHAYQAFKTFDPAQRAEIANALTPGQAKRLGQKVTLRKGWDEEKLMVMKQLLAEKFDVGSELAQRLLATGDAELVEGNTWGDKFWGVYNGQGYNHLGVLLMARRTELATW